MKEMGVNYIFGIPGSGNVPLYDELYDFTEINPIVVNHEQAAAFMADGYYRITHRIAACTGTGGPGAVNLISGLDESFQDSIPVLAITTNVPAVELRKDKDFST
jgi:acetolactate synthase-1/2/3 large subunit